MRPTGTPQSLFRTLLLFVALCVTGAHADPQSEAKQLKDEALKILKENSTKTASAEEYATCIVKLEKAQSLLEGANDSDSALAQEVASSLFWARRFSNVDVINVIQKMRGKAPMPVPVRRTPPPAAKPAPGTPPDSPEVARAKEADKAFGDAQSFATSHHDDDYAVALRWFQMAGEYAGTDAALKALELAREAQKRHMAKSGTLQASAEESADLPAAAKTSDGLVEHKQYENAIGVLRDAVKQDDTPLLRRRLAKAIFFRAQQIKDELKPKFDANNEDYKRAWNGAWRQTSIGRVFNPDDPGLTKVKRETASLLKESDGAMKLYQEAEINFKAILKAAPDNKDFEAAAYVGLCQSSRPFFKRQGQRTLEDFTKAYTPANDLERTLYEFCKAEIERIRKGQ
jgi:hypothetical protein